MSATRDLSADPPERPLARIGVLGDVHAESTLVRMALVLFRGERVDRVVAVGDIADGPGDLDATVKLLADASVEAVRGNHDRWLLAGELRDLPDATRNVAPETRTYLAGLPVTRRYQTVAGAMLLCHGLGENDMAKVKAHDDEAALATNGDLQRLVAGGAYRFVVNGHTHEAMVRTVASLTIINAGTLHRGYPQTVTIVDFDAGTASFHAVEQGRIARPRVVPLAESR